MNYKNTGLIISPYYITTMVYNPVKEKGLKCSKKQNPHVTTFLLCYDKVVTTNHQSYYINYSVSQVITVYRMCSK